MKTHGLCDEVEVENVRAWENANAIETISALFETMEQKEEFEAENRNRNRNQRDNHFFGDQMPLEGM